MHKLILALTVALSAGAPLAEASVVDFNNPGVIDIDNGTGAAVYREAGFTLTGNAAGFLPIDGAGTGGTGGLLLLAGNTISIMSGSGSPFNFSALDAGRYDAATAATLGITGIFSNSAQQNLMLTLGELGTQPLSAWNGLTELRFTASADVVVDNVVLSAVPEPASFAMLLLGLGAVFGLRRNRSGGR
jgi:hypothetical protein